MIPEMRTPPMPPPPPRTTSHPVTKVTFQGAQMWKESIGIFFAFALCVTVFIALLTLTVYVWRDKQVYDELVDYLDKTISISKINYNPMLGLYQLSEKELDVLSEQRTYKNLLRLYLLTDFGVLVLFGVAALFYFTSDVSGGTRHIAFWVLMGLGTIYAIVQAHLFSFAISPYSVLLPNATEKLLNHAIPHNPGGLQQMEQRLGCTFDHNLYAANRRRLNPRNSCDPQIEASFIPRAVLFALLGFEMLAVVAAVLLLLKRTPLSERVAQLVEKLRPNHKKRQHSSGYEGGEPKSTTFGVTSSPPRITSTPLPPVPSPAQFDHSISYNNAAYFATSSAFGPNSSRSSEISRIDTHDLFKNPINRHPSGSIQSEV